LIYYYGVSTIIIIKLCHYGRLTPRLLRIIIIFQRCYGAATTTTGYKLHCARAVPTYLNIYFLPKKCINKTTVLSSRTIRHNAGTRHALCKRHLSRTAMRSVSTKRFLFRASRNNKMKNRKIGACGVIEHNFFYIIIIVLKLHDCRRLVLCGYGT